MLTCKVASTSLQLLSRSNLSGSFPTWCVYLLCILLLTDIEQDDDGFILYESRAIAIYIATKYANQGTPLVPEPTDLVGQALLNQAISAELSNFNIWALLALTENVFKPYVYDKPSSIILLIRTQSKYYGQPGNPEAFKAYISELETKLDGYEKILAKSKYVAGDVRF